MEQSCFWACSMSHISAEPIYIKVLHEYLHRSLGSTLFTYPPKNDDEGALILLICLNIPTLLTFACFLSGTEANADVARDSISTHFRQTANSAHTSVLHQGDHCIMSDWPLDANKWHVYCSAFLILILVCVGKEQQTQFSQLFFLVVLYISTFNYPP